MKENHGKVLQLVAWKSINRILLQPCLCTFLLLFCANMLFAQDIPFPTARFATGDIMGWKEKNFDDSEWGYIHTTRLWEDQGYENYDGYAWYRLHFYLPEEMLQNSFLKKKLHLYLGKIDDADEVYLNGVLVGKTGSFPGESKGFSSAYETVRDYEISTKHPALEWGGENVLAIRVFDQWGGGGLYGNITPYLTLTDLIDGISLDVKKDEHNGNKYIVTLKNSLKQVQNGKLQIKVENTGKENSSKSIYKTIELKSRGTYIDSIFYPSEYQRIKFHVVYIDDNTGKTKQLDIVPPYILTPEESPLPRINGAKVFGVRPGSPFLFKIAASGEKPMTYTVKNLPKGLSVNPDNGVITGVLNEAQTYTMTFVVSNRLGQDERDFVVKVGDNIALTPPMGWNSWNSWGCRVSDERVRAAARAMRDKGLMDYGWTYINIDDCWQDTARDNNGTLNGNERFPDMKALGNWLHGMGLKFGIYSSPGKRTCAGYLGSYKYEEKDAKTYADWGIDYLKYDWCTYSEIYDREGDKTMAADIKPYLTMQKYLKTQKRDIVYSLCQYGRKDVWDWARAVDGNCWRTTGDLFGGWKSLKNIGFTQAKLYPYASPGHWNDPDMLIVGLIGWGDNLYPTELTTDEQYTHISLWCLLASPLLIGCDMNRLDNFTLKLLTNSEVLAINQDPLGKQARKILEVKQGPLSSDNDENSLANVESEGIQVWEKELEDGSRAIGFFNLMDNDVTYKIDTQKFSITTARDLWRQTDVLVKENMPLMIPSHGVVLWKVK
ncbi:MAG: putative Ig domain-containing protein [Bacteroidales bacterium]|jgi:hypothetical protein|nr:putative Ig domain-containing protein [Bacteroidales bacterium]